MPKLFWTTAAAKFDMFDSIPIPNECQYRTPSNTIDITNWRFIKRGFYIKDKNMKEEIEGVYLKTIQTVFIPNTSIDDILYYDKVCNKETLINKYFIESYYIEPPLCTKCWGKGKFDWVERIISPTPRHYKHILNSFQRNIHIKLVFDNNENFVFSRTMLDPGDEYCSQCLGTGLFLDDITFENINQSKLIELPI